MSAIINGDSPSITFSDGTTQATSIVVGGKVPYSILPAGSVLQVVQTVKQDIFSTTSTSYTNITGLSVSITPKFSTSKILVFCTVNFGTNVDDALVQLVRNSSTALGNGTGGSANNGFAQVSSSYLNMPLPASINYLDSPATTSATTYGVQILVYSATAYVNRRGNNASFGTSSQITAMEIAG
jgi:hypothetical protein